jgi:hypothetical protein
MKKLLWFVVLGTSSALGQLAVYDPANHAVNLAVQSAQHASHVEILRQWAAQLESLNRQIQQLESQLAEQRRIREVLGNPTAAGAGVALDLLGELDLARTYGETLQAVQRLANAATSLRRTAEGVFVELDDRTSLKSSFARQDAPYRRYAAVERQADNFSAVLADTDAQTAGLQVDLARTLTALRDAPTQAEVDKLNVKVAALNGQLAQLGARKRDEADKLRTQQILNDNQAAKERQDLLEKQIAEERQTLSAVNDWQRSLKITPTGYTRP